MHVITLTVLGTRIFNSPSHSDYSPILHCLPHILSYSYCSRVLYREFASKILVPLHPPNVRRKDSLVLKKKRQLVWFIKLKIYTKCFFPGIDHYDIISYNSFYVNVCLVLAENQCENNLCFFLCHVFLAKFRHRQWLKTGKGHFKDTENTKEGKWWPKVKTIETYCDMDFWNNVCLNWANWQTLFLQTLS